MIKVLKGIIAFSAVWLPACAIADYVMPEIANAYMMLWGFAAGLFSFAAWHVATKD